MKIKGYLTKFYDIGSDIVREERRNLQEKTITAGKQPLEGRIPIGLNRYLRGDGGVCQRSF